MTAIQRPTGGRAGGPLRLAPARALHRGAMPLLVVAVAAAAAAGCVEGLERSDGAVPPQDRGADRGPGGDHGRLDGQGPDRTAGPDHRIVDRSMTRPDACTPETGPALCARLGKNCGTLTANDNCGKPRTVTCGTCTAPKLCGGAGVANRCDACAVPKAAQSCQGGFCRVPAGCFMMGSPTGEPCREPDASSSKETRHQVLLTRAFDLARTETTQAQFHQVMGYNPSIHTGCGNACPVDQVSWHEAAAYCNALTQQPADRCYTCTGSGSSVRCAPAAGLPGGAIQACKGYRLPTEAEWEHAYRAGTTTALYNGPLTKCTGTDPNATAIGHYFKASGFATQPAGQKQQNAWGLYDMAGNAFEWCHDGHKNDLGAAAATDPVTQPSSTFKNMIRGGSFESPVAYVRAAFRYFGWQAGGSDRDIGFRCARTR